jgi:hypothetical protein
MTTSAVATRKEYRDRRLAPFFFENVVVNTNAERVDPKVETDVCG